MNFDETKHYFEVLVDDVTTGEEILHTVWDTRSDATIRAEDLAVSISEDGITGRTLVRAYDGYMIFAVQVRGTLMRVSDESLGGDYAYFLEDGTQLVHRTYRKDR
jgi:hypothetical protein